jgi:uncharacterized protein YecE (DUF72 family)
LADAQSEGLDANFYIGTMGWSYGFWKGGFYPEDLASKDFLAFYSKQFNSVEVDNTFYRIPALKTVLDWKQQTPGGFKFSFKFPQRITHVKMLKDAQEDTSVFLQNVDLLKEKLGVLLLQFPPIFRQKHLPQLAEYLKALPKSYRYAVEVRNKSLLNSETYAVLRDSNVALVWVDAAKMPQVTEATADFVFVRWVGDRKTVMGKLGKTETDQTSKIHEWAEKLIALARGGTEVYGYFSKYYSGFPPDDVAELLKHSK